MKQLIVDRLAKVSEEEERMVTKTKRRVGHEKNGGEFANHTVCTTVRAAKLDDYALR